MRSSSPARWSRTTGTRSPSSSSGTSRRCARRLRKLTAGNHALADDLAQETFVLAWRNLKSFRQEAKFSTWLYRIATNCWLADARKRKEELLGDRADAVADEDDDAMPHIDDEVHADHAKGASLKMDLERAMARCPRARGPRSCSATIMT